MVGRGFGLTAEQRHNGLCVVVVDVGHVEAVEQRFLRCRGDVNVGQLLAREESRHDGFVALHECVDKGLGVLVCVELRLDVVAAAADQGFDIDGRFERRVDQSCRLHAVAVLVEHLTMPGEHRGRLKAKVGHHITIGV